MTTHIAAPGASGGSGTLASPYSLGYALSGAAPIAPGDTLELRGGPYVGDYDSFLTGTQSSPIQVKAYPGERPVLDGSLYVYGAYTDYRRLWVTQSAPYSTLSRNGFNLRGPYTRLIHCFAHDVNQNGFAKDESAVGAEIYGCYGWRNGYDLSGQGHGHGVYPQNLPGVRFGLRNCFFWENYGLGVHAYGQGGQMCDLDIEDVVSFENGLGSASGVRRTNILCRAGSPLRGIALRRNIAFEKLLDGSLAINVDLGNLTDASEDLLIDDLLVIGGGGFALRAVNWQSITQRRVFVYGNRGMATLYPSVPPTKDFRENTYRRVIDPDPAYTYKPPFESNNAASYAKWQTDTGETDSTYVEEPPTGGVVKIVPSVQEPGTLHITLVDFEQTGSVAVDLAPYLTLNQSYQVFRVTDFDNPLLEGVFEGSPVLFPMTEPLFGAFVLMTGEVVPPIDPPTCVITLPADQSHIPHSAKKIYVSVDATDPSGVQRVEVYVNGGVLKATWTTAPYQGNLSIPNWSAGPHPVYALCYGVNGTVTQSETITVIKD